MTIPSQERDALAFYLAFSALAALTLALPIGAPGHRVIFLVVSFNLALPAIARWRGHEDWLRAWLFLLPLSILQVCPDWFLSAQLVVLVFPDIGAPMIGTVSSFMALMWVIPLFLVILAGEGARTRHGTAAGLAAAASTALLIFALSELFSWRIPLWYAQNVLSWQHMALYVLPAELLLGLYTYAGYLLTRDRGRALQLAAAASIMLLYLGALALSFLLIETI